MTDRPEEIGMDSKTPAVRDRVDLGHEMAGLETGRIKRFIADGASGYASDTEEKKARREQRSLLQMLLTEDPHYAALYQRVSEKLNDAQQAVESALVDINQRLEASGRKLQQMRDNAGELEDGTKVFRSSFDGSIYTEDGQRLSDEDAQNINIPEDAASWEEYRREKEERDLALRQREEIERYKREVLDPAKERMNDPHNPYHEDELKELEKRIDGEIPEHLRGQYVPELSATSFDNASFSVAHDMVEETDISSMPEMGKSFKLASTDIPDLGPAPGSAPVQQATRTLS